MKYRGPVVTLLAVAALAAVLLVVNMRTVAETAARGTSSPAAPPATAPPAKQQPPAGQAGNGQVPVVTEPPAPAAPPPAPPAKADYAGRSSGNEATIAIAVNGDAASAYVCDGAQIESWLDGAVENGQFTLRGADGTEVTGAVQDGAVFGTIFVQGEQWPYSAQPAEAPAGLYDGRGTVDGEPARVGWIVLQDGSQVGVADIGGVPRPAPALDPRLLSGVEVGGSTIVPRPVDGADDVVLPPS